CALIATAVLATAACGGDDDDDTSSDDTSASAPATEAPSATDGGSATTAGGGTEPVATTEDSSATTDGGDAAPAAEPSGSLKAAYPAGSRSLDPHKQAYVVDAMYTFPLFDRLTKINNKTFAVEPMLATSWEFAADGSTLTMELRDDVTFNDGTPFDAAAVVANIEQQINGDDTFTMKGLLSSVASVEATGDYEVVFTLNPGVGAELPENLATAAGAMISPEAIAAGTDLTVTPGDAGSGAYLLTEYDPTAKYVYDNAPADYWDPEAGRLEQLEIDIVPQTAARVTAVRTGEADFAHIQLPEAMEALDLADQGEFNAFKVENFLSSHALEFNGADPALSDPDVRKAIAMAIDRQGISDGLFGGGCTVSDDIYPESHWAANPEMEGTLTYDPEAAQQLLTDAGVTSMDVNMLVIGGGSPFELVATAVQAQLQEVGINATIDPRATAADALVAFRNNEAPMFESSITASPSPSVLLNDYFIGTYPLVADEASRTEITDEASSALDPALDQEERGDIYRDIWTKVADGNWYVPVCRTFQTYAYGDNVGGIEDMGLIYSGYFDFRSVYVEE
ncbi:MAG: ABC transporter substrate-binding protein, partial [Ilumatobacteraceae bacterium]